jgi:hypothetical protein
LKQALPTQKIEIKQAQYTKKFKIKVTTLILKVAKELKISGKANIESMVSIKEPP